jgi:AbrB family looped-hinge helix DNA binding protein
MPYGFPYRRTVTLTSKGQITLPVELRRSWNLAQGDQLDFVLTEDVCAAAEARTASKNMSSKVMLTRTCSGPKPRIATCIR